MTLVYLAMAWLAGVFLGLAHPWLARLALLAGAAGIALLVLWWRRPPVRTAILCGVVVAFALGRASLTVGVPGESHIARHNGETVAVQGVVSAEPVHGRGSQRLVVQVEGLVSGADRAAADGAVLVTTARFPEYRYGDRVEANGRLETPPDFDGFNYRDYLARQGISSLLRYPTLRRLAGEPPQDGWALLTAARKSANAEISRLLPEPQASLAAALLLGDRANLPDDLVEAFRVAGLSHVLAISGWQVTLVVGLLSGVCGSLLRRRAALSLLVSLAAVAAYVLLVGASPSVVRAGVMGGVILLAAALGRPRDGLVALALACALMTAVDPAIILDVGFQLSALATWGLVMLSPPLLRLGARLPGWMWPVLASTFAAQVAVLPVLLTAFRQVSLVAVAANLAVVPLVPGAMEWTALGVGLGPLWAPLGNLAGSVATLYLSALVWGAETAAALPFAAASVDPPAPVVVVAYYGVLLLFLDRDRSGRWLSAIANRLAPAIPLRRALPVAIAAVLLLGSAVVWQRDDSLRVSFLDVGQGDAVLLRTPGGRHVLIDGGPDGVAVANALGRRLPYGAKRIDLVVLSHPHDDHLVGLIDVVQDYKVGQVLQGPPPAHPSPAYRRWTELLETLRVPTLSAQTGQSVDLGQGGALRVLYAGEAWGGDDAFANDASLVLAVERGEFSLLLPGDAGPVVQQWLVAKNQALAATVLKVPHHGSSSGLDEGFVRLVTPREAVVSVGRSNRFGHPAASTLALLAGAGIYRTDLNGTVELEVSAGGYRISPSR